MFENDCNRNPMTHMAVQKLAATQRPVETDEIAAACLFLCGPSSVSITGVNLPIDTGLGLGAAAAF